VLDAEQDFPCISEMGWFYRTRDKKSRREIPEVEDKPTLAPCMDGKERCGTF
jgi:hypothetical protein